MLEREIHSKLHYSIIYKYHNVDTMSKLFASWTLNHVSVQNKPV